ncbi:methionine--tRNA ligase [Buchnera aphidicola]|uniref:Methionine--tRNA ligase n=1 Tax=Buchnera aphidicola (Stegophylla sp.) TaxID=2315800 RepID=A0A4D6Y9A7_9GAMM|nr:methionine--tRNA ligase [Buchnera aphidicola (Stegophylla sp.)]QCI26267.1 methionine--tRNA ligase [Buchnera aphidicola (Stegophylla sp.)]
MKKKFLVTCALPYANGSMHIGHMFEHIQADIWVRHQRMLGHQVWFICSDDAHGTAIMIQAKKMSITPKQLINTFFQEHKNDLKSFNILYDYYSSTHSNKNKYFVKKIYYTLQLKQLIKQKNILQLYDVKEKIFLPDRFVKGICPICYVNNQYGDNCESCGSIYKAIELIRPLSNLSGTVPIIRSSNHLFFNLNRFKQSLHVWINSGVLQKQILNKTKEWFNLGLKQWNISRDAPYFGFKIPNTHEKYFYVWLDAIICYISTFKELCDKSNFLDFYEFWNIDSQIKLYHFIGKDIIYFHTLFWPAILEAVNFRKPNKIFVHGYVTWNGTKLSKSRSSLILVKKWFQYLGSDSLRYYYASKLSSNIDDIEINFQELINKINSDLVNKIVNLASRSSSFLKNYFDNILSLELDDKQLYQIFIDSSKMISSFFKKREFNLVIKHLVKLSNLANQYIDNQKPWRMSVIDNYVKLHNVCSMGVQLFYVIMIFIKPILPDLAKKTELFLMKKLCWSDIHKPLLGHRINLFYPLYNKIELNVIKKFF